MEKNNKIRPKNSSMDKILIKRIQTHISHYFSSVAGMTRPEARCLRDMATGILKSKTVLVNRIAASLREPLRLKDVCKRLYAQYLKDGYAERVRWTHLATACKGVSKRDFIVMDGTDIQKKCAKYMDGLELVKDGDTDKIGLGYNLLNIKAINGHGEVAPLLSKAYSYEMGALSSNNEIKKAVAEVREHLGDRGTWVYDRQGDCGILKDFFFTECGQCILRLKANTMAMYKGKNIKVSQLAKGMELPMEQRVVRTKKNKQVVELYDIGAVPVEVTAKGKAHRLWLVATRNKRHGGMCHLLAKAPADMETAIEVARWAFKGYGARWKVEECHRHIKQQYGLEDVQIKTWTGLQSMLAILTVAMYVVYKGTRAMHMDLLLDSGYNYLNKNVPRELCNFIYYKIGKVISNLLTPVRMRWKPTNPGPIVESGQMALAFN